MEPASTGNGSSAAGSSATDLLPQPSAGQVLRPVTDSVAGQVLRPVTDSVAGQVLRPVTDSVVGAAGTHILRPVGDLVDSVVEGLAEAGADTPSLPGLPGLPGVPTSPSSPSVPDLPTPPELPADASGLPDVPELPGQVLPVPHTPAPGTPQPGAVAPSAPSAGPAAGGQGGTPARTTGAVAFGPRLNSGVLVADAAAHSPARRTAAGGPAPSHRAPGDTDGALAGQSTADGGTSRPGDAHAVNLTARAPLPLVPGAAASEDAAGTRDTYRDIPVFPG
ncbi:hypothetical protein ABZ920_09050 [Streptomyces sp. NPDC046831]|uniref:hypothetical protein n=1 Tax=Streptomyces sp. NPDC046831 TaxID=3154805 RepID=UPI003411AB60